MATLLDIAPSAACEAVWIDGHRFTVRGLSPNAIASIFTRFPEIKSVIENNGDVLMLIRKCGQAIGPIIAAGCGYFEDADQEQAATNLPLDRKAIFLAAIWRLTFPNGISSFLEAVTKLGNTIGGMDEGAKPIKVRSRNSSKASRSTSSPSAGGSESHQTMQ